MIWFRKCIFVRRDGVESQVKVCLIRTTATAETVAQVRGDRYGVFENVTSHINYYIISDYGS